MIGKETISNAQSPDALPAVSMRRSTSRGSSAALRRIVLRPEIGGAISAIIVFLFFAIAAGSSGFLSVLGTAYWLDTASELGIVAIPVGMLMIAGEFDLSVGAMVGAASMIVAICTGYYGLDPLAGVGVAFVVAVLVGFMNGMIVVKTKLPSFIVTLSTMFMTTGAILGVSIALTGSSSISAVPTGLASVIFAYKWNEFHISLLHWVILATLATWVLQNTRFGNWIYATGGNVNTARLAGVPTNRVKIVLFVLSAVGAAFVGILQTYTFQNGSVTLGAQYVFSGIAACVIGGVLLTGGYGSLVGTAFGAMTYGIVSMGVFFLGWNADLTELFIGALLLMAVMTNNRLRRFAMGR